MIVYGRRERGTRKLRMEERRKGVWKTKEIEKNKDGVDDGRGREGNIVFRGIDQS